MKRRRLNNETPTLLRAVEETILASPIIRFSQFWSTFGRRKSIKYRKEVMLFWRNCDQTYCFFREIDVDEENDDVTNDDGRSQAFIFWITLQDCLDKEYNFHMICIIINLILSARTERTTERSYIFYAYMLNDGHALRFSKTEPKRKKLTYSILLSFFNVPHMSCTQKFSWTIEAARVHY